jgi:hypothetical protein
MKEEKSLFKESFNNILIVLILVLIILTFGWFVKKEKIEKEIKNIESRIKDIYERILILRNKKKKLEEIKKLRFLLVRIIIGIILITVNYLFIKNTIKVFDLRIIFNSVLTINGIILMGYSFIAFISYGTISNFSSALKSKITYILEKKHIDSIEELILLEDELNILTKKLQEKEMEKETFDVSNTDLWNNENKEIHTKD